MLDQSAMARTLFPVGDITKARVREMALDLGLRTATKPDSQDVCFITSDGGRRAFLGDRIPLRSAAVRDLDGNTVGSVDAVELVTIGQRRGLTLSGAPSRRFVLDVDVPRGEVTVGSAEDLLREREHVEQVVWTSSPSAGDVLVQCSAHGEPQRATIRPGGASIEVVWAEPQRRVAPGQSAVFYSLANDEVLGGGRVRR
ncbi:unannotated protein [freshwater metagenome]